MLTLYYKPACPFCQRVMQMAENFNVELDLRDVEESEEAMAELLEKGGQKVTPFLVDTESGVSMYESNDIIDYLRDVAKTATPVASVNKPRVHIGGSTCVSCEG
jgi:glutaredoxin 3